MAANPLAVAGNPFFDYLTGTLLLSNEISVAVMDEGVQDFAQLVTLRDSDISEIVGNIRKPGGYLDANGAVVAPANAVAPNRGIRVTELNKTKLRQLGYYCFHMNRISRRFIAAEATLVRLEELWQFRDMEGTLMKVEVPEPPSDYY